MVCNRSDLGTALTRRSGGGVVGQSAWRHKATRNSRFLHLSHYY